ncbi:holin [Mycobacterium phage Sham4]|nr:holin [Mycobacterium phage Jabith]ASR86648.1 hypothetical protein SEA_ET2BRUTUS_10 [Mycobacterium phage Et2Brutus]UAW08882.1 holin [Mycobacterium phage Lucivia]UOW92657.1 holin [Mycobacterium phage Sham4]
MSTRLAQTVYYLGTIVPSVLGILLLWNGIDAGAAENIGQIIAGLLNLIGAGAPATAAVRVNRQIKDGTLTSSASEQVVKGVEQVLAARDAAEAEVAKVKEALGSAVAGTPLGPLATQVLNGHAGSIRE